jgi:hypothetical protein
MPEAPTDPPADRRGRLVTQGLYGVLEKGCGVTYGRYPASGLTEVGVHSAPAFRQVYCLHDASLLTVIPPLLALFWLDDRSPSSCWLVVIAVRLGVEVWCVAMNRSEPATAT